MEFRLASVVFIAVFATYLFLGGMGVSDRGNPNPRDAPHNLLARGLLSGHLYLDLEAPPELAQLKDPYSSAANRVIRVDPRYGLHDYSYYRGRMYLCFGIASALFIFIPWHLLTGGWLPQWSAVVLLCSAGLLVNLSLVHAVKRRVFPGSSPWLMAACALILGLGSYVPMLTARPDMWEVPISFDYCMVSIALMCLWQAYENPGHSTRWVAFASTAFGIGFAARSTVLPGAAILLIPFLSAEMRRSARAWAAAVVPLGLAGAGVALYNIARFGNPFDFGVKYALAGDNMNTIQLFSPGYFWTDLRLNLFQPVEWSSVFPFVGDPVIRGLPPNYGGTEHISGALLNSPILWAALAVPALIRARRQDRSLLLLSVSVAWIALSSLSVFSFFYFACSRYQVEYVPALALLASLGVMALESAWSGRLRAVARCVWIPALLLSSAFPVLYGIERCASDRTYSGLICLQYNDLSGAEREFNVARFLSPGRSLLRFGTSLVLIAQGKSREAQGVLAALVRDFPDYAMAHFALGNVLAGEGRRDEALEQYRTAHRLDPGDASIKAVLDSALARGEAAQPPQRAPGGSR